MTRTMTDPNRWNSRLLPWLLILNKDVYLTDSHGLARC